MHYSYGTNVNVKYLVETRKIRKFQMGTRVIISSEEIKKTFGMDSLLERR